MAAVNRYSFTQKTVKDAIKFIQTGDGKKPNFLKRFTGTVKKVNNRNFLYLDDKFVVLKDGVDTLLRNRIYKGRTPMTRDAAYYWLQKNTVGISRKNVDDFLKKQRVIRETDNQQATTKRKTRRVNKKGQLHIDLVEIKFKHLGFEPTLPRSKKLTEAEKAEGEEDNKGKGYFFGCVDSLTSLAFYRYVNRKSYELVTPVAKEAFQWFSKMLDVPMHKMTIFSDSGSEFEWKAYNKWGIRTIIVKMDPRIEAKNSHFQRILYRIAKMNTTRSLSKLTELAMTQLNRTRSSVSKKAPVENIKDNVSDLADRYNKKRGKDTGVKIKYRKLIPGKDKVRIKLKAAKDKIMHKSYHGDLWSKRLYQVKTKRGNRYTVNGKLYHRDDLRLTVDYDQKSEMLIRKRT